MNSFYFINWYNKFNINFDLLGGPLHNKKEKYYLSQAEIKPSFNEKFANAKYKFHKERMIFRAKLYKMDKTASYQIRVNNLYFILFYSTICIYHY